MVTWICRVTASGLVNGGTVVRPSTSTVSFPIDVLPRFTRQLSEGFYNVLPPYVRSTSTFTTRFDSRGLPVLMDCSALYPLHECQYVT